MALNPWLKANMLPLGGVAACALGIVSCTSVFDGLEKPGPSTASAGTRIEDSTAWRRAVASGKVAEAANQASDVGSYFLPPPFNQVVNNVGDKSEAYALALFERLEELQAKQATGEQVTQTDVYKAMAMAAGIGGLGAFFKRKGVA